MANAKSAFGGISILFVALIVVAGFIYISAFPNETMLAPQSFGAIALAGVVAMTLGLIVALDFNTQVGGYIAGLVCYFVLLKVLAGFP